MIKRGGQPSETYTTYGWHPDQEIRPGFCLDCKQYFDNTMPKQIYCNPCRSKYVPVDSGSETRRLEREDDLILKPGFMYKFLLPKESFKSLVKRLKLDVRTDTLHQWNKMGRVPARSGGVARLCKALKMSKTELEQRFGR